MADVSWTRTALADNVDFYTATLTSTDTDTALLKLDPNARTVTIMLDVGTGESCNMLMSNSPNGANAQVVQSTINADYDDRADGGITGIKFNGTITTNTIVCRVLQVKS